jgi:tRNA pseudouridine38-40 synthase
MRFRGVLAYDGTGYAGFQRQARATSIQGEVERALAQVLGRQTPIVGAGRTDAGVHALGQVIAFDADWAHPPQALLTAVNLALPKDIVLQSLAVADAGFHPRYGVLSRAYRYDVTATAQANPLQTRFAWHVTQSLALEAMNEGASLLVGRHDFATFGKPPQGENTVRHVLRSEWTHNADGGYSYHIEATAFLHHMVRRIVQMLVDIGRGWRSVTAFEQAFRAANLRHAGRIAPPQGLILVAVRYAPPTHTNEKIQTANRMPSEDMKDES